MSTQAKLKAIRARIAAIEAGAARMGEVLPFGDRRIDGVFPGGGLPLGRWHEAVGEGPGTETRAAPAAFVPRLPAPLARRGGMGWAVPAGRPHPPRLPPPRLPPQNLLQGPPAHAA